MLVINPQEVHNVPMFTVCIDFYPGSSILKMSLENAGLYGVFLCLNILFNPHLPVIYILEDDQITLLRNEFAQFS